MHQYFTKPWTLNVIPDPENKGKLLVEGNTFIVANVDPNGLEPAVMPMLGYIGTTTINVRSQEERAYSMPKSHPLAKKALAEDERISSTMQALILSNSSWTIFNKPSHRAIDNWYNNFRRLASTARPVNTMAHLKHMLRSKDIIFLGAGPSLAEAKDELIELMRYDDRPIIMAGGSAIRILCEWGIDPDYCIALDPYDNQKEAVFDQLDEDWMARQTWIVSMHLNSHCFREVLYEAKRVYVNPTTRTVPLVAELMEHPEFCSEGSVGVTTFMLELVKYCEAGKIQLVGVDLTFKDGVAYADNYKCNIYEAEKIRDNNVETRQVWINEAYHIETESAGPLKNKILGYAGQNTRKLRNVRYLPELLTTSQHQREERPGTLLISDKSLEICEELHKMSLVDTNSEQEIMNHPLFHQLLLPYFNVGKAQELRGMNPEKDLVQRVLEHHRKQLSKTLISLKEYVQDVDILVKRW